MNELAFGDPKSFRFPVPDVGHRDWYAYEAIRALPRLILMVDKNPYSRTYGCFDREYWHYRTVDFACGMNQEMGFPLALAYANDFGGQNPYVGKRRLAELALAAVDFAVEITHKDGSTDDYFPFEKALGANVFSTYAMSETLQVLDDSQPKRVSMLQRRADWLLRNNESGQLANHQAFAALALQSVYELTGDTRYRDGAKAYRDIALSWQHEEGWFQEYEGADPGYHSCSIAFLGKLWKKTGDDTLVLPLTKAVEFASYFLHPDGSYGGEYGSRNTYHFYPHGFELLAPKSPIAGRIAQTYLSRSLPNRTRYTNDDNRMASHYVYDWMQAWNDYATDHRDGTLEEHRGAFERWFSGAKLWVRKTSNYYAVLSLAKGGVIKVFDRNGPRYSDTGLIGETMDGRVLVSHLVDEHTCHWRPGIGEVSGFLSYRKQQLSSPGKQMAFRAMNLTVGRLHPDLVRRSLQKILITGKPRSEVRFSRRVVLEERCVTIYDTVDLSAVDFDLRRLSRGSDATSIYVANSNTYQDSVVLPWTHLSSKEVSHLNQKRKVELAPIRIEF